MTQLKERAVEMIQRMPEEKMFYVMNIFHNLEVCEQIPCLVLVSVILRKWHYRITMEHVKVIKLWLTSGKLRKKLQVDDTV